jgi:hypothetical protein
VRELRHEGRFLFVWCLEGFFSGIFGGIAVEISVDVWQKLLDIEMTPSLKSNWWKCELRKVA